MFTDMVGSTAAAQSNEAEALRLRDEQESILRPLFSAHSGREIKSIGDGFLVVFDSALTAVQCAIDIQEHLRARNGQPGVPPIQLRVAVHLGDVEERAGDIFGDAVNVASRIEPLAEPGGICVSEPVFGQVRNKIPNPFVRMDPVALKGVRFPFDTYRVALTGPAPEAGPTELGPESNRLAVLPFANISPDPNDAYFSEGLTEELITVLSQLGGLRVIARTSVEPYKTSPKPIPQVGADLGVNWVLEGSVRKAQARLRITVQLIDVRTQEHVWATTYDRELTDVFAVQSEMAQQVAESLRVKLPTQTRARLDQRPIPGPESYLEYLQGRTQLRSLAESDLRAAQGHFEKAVSLDDRNAAAHAGLADAHRLLGGMYHHLPTAEWEATSRRHASRAIELDPALAEAHASLALILWDDYDFAAAERELNLAISLNPSYAWARMWHAAILGDWLRVEEALRELDVAEQLDPLSALLHAGRINLLSYLRRLDEAEADLEKLGKVENFGILYHDCRLTLDVVRGDLEGVRRDLDRLEELLPGRPELVTGRSLYHVLKGDGDQARAMIQSVEGLPDATRPDNQIASIYARLGDLDATFRWLDRAVGLKKFSIQHWRIEPAMAHVRNDPRFQALLKKINLA
jgi:adenylate cyclase